MLPLISGRPRIVATVNCVLKQIAAVAFDRGNTVGTHRNEEWIHWIEVLLITGCMYMYTYM